MQLPNPLKPDPYKPNPTVPVKPIGAPTGAAARLGLGQAPNITGPVSHAAPTVQPQAEPTSQLKLQQNLGWKFGPSIAAQNAADPMQRLSLLSRNIVTQQPGMKTANALDRMTFLLNSLVAKPIPSSIKVALGI